MYIQQKAKIPLMVDRSLQMVDRTARSFTTSEDKKSKKKKKTATVFFQFTKPTIHFSSTDKYFA